MERSLVIFNRIKIFTFSLLLITAFSCDNSSQEEEGSNIPFSHKTHIENYKIEKCETCHKYNDHGVFKGNPSIGECTVCHDREGAITGTDRTIPRKKSIFDNYTDKDRPWVSKSKDPVNIYYSHKVAMTTTLDDGTKKLKCEPCHGHDINSNKPSTLSYGELMAQCIECHTTYNMNNECGVCHSRR